LEVKKSKTLPHEMKFAAIRKKNQNRQISLALVPHNKGVMMTFYMKKQKEPKHNKICVLDITKKCI
jgi:hypothetical protein